MNKFCKLWYYTWSLNLLQRFFEIFTSWASVFLAKVSIIKYAVYMNFESVDNLQSINVLCDHNPTESWPFLEIQDQWKKKKRNFFLLFCVFVFQTRETQGRRQSKSMTIDNCKQESAHLDRDNIQSNLSVPGIQGCHENVLIKCFEAGR